MSISGHRGARQQRERVLHRRYKPLPGSTRSICFYCGAAPNCIDHAPPLAVVYDLGQSYFEDQGVSLWLIPACEECNRLLGFKSILTPYERRRFIAERLREKYEKILATPRWTEDQLKPMGHSLRKQIEAYNQVCEVLKRRIGFAERD